MNKRTIIASPGIIRPRERFAGRRRTGDVAFTYRMGAGFAGDINRSHPFSAEPTLNDAGTPVLGFGLACLTTVAGNSVRQMAAGDVGVTEIWGVSIRPFPFQQQTGGMTANMGGEVPIVGGVLDVLKQGYIMVPIVGAVVKGGPVYVWVAASGGGHVQGGFEAGATGGSTAALSSQYAFNGPADNNGIGELIVRD